LLWLNKSPSISLPLEMAKSLSQKHILLADDDMDDCLLFANVLEELLLPVKLTLIHDGEELTQLLYESQQMPDIVFLDLNMPRKNGLACLAEIKKSEKLRQLPVVIFSTSYEVEVINRLYSIGAQFYIRKPNDFSQLRTVVEHALTLSTNIPNSQPSFDEFVLYP
jgi:CheY-like chemotaxis protein